MYKIISNYL